MARRYLAGADTHRATDLASAIAGSSIDGIWCLQASARRVCCRSDATRRARGADRLLHHRAHAAWRRAGVLVSWTDGAWAIPPFTLDSFMRAVVRGVDSGIAEWGDGDPRGSRPASWRARTALVAALCGAMAIDFAGAIVVLEDVNEATYRIDRVPRSCNRRVRADVSVSPWATANGDEPSGRRSRPLEDVVREFADAPGYRQ
jgi:muramoyltetrapeptide carboxypeptidase